MATIAEWLASLGLSEYAQSFAKNDIEADVLCELTDQDLERLGVSLGHRRRMLRAIRELGSPAVVAGAERKQRVHEMDWRTNRGQTGHWVLIIPRTPR